MKLWYWLGRVLRGDSIGEALNERRMRRVMNILEDIQGEGFHVYKPKDNPRGWRVVFDGVRSDSVGGAGGQGISATDPLRPHDPFHDDDRVSVVGHAWAYAARGGRNLVAAVPGGSTYLVADGFGAGVSSSPRPSSRSNGPCLPIAKRDGDKLTRISHGNQHCAYCWGAMDYGGLEVDEGGEAGTGWKPDGWDTADRVSRSSYSACSGRAVAAIDRSDADHRVLKWVDLQSLFQGAARLLVDLVTAHVVDDLCDYVMSLVPDYMPKLRGNSGEAHFAMGMEWKRLDEIDDFDGTYATKGEMDALLDEARGLLALAQGLQGRVDALAAEVEDETDAMDAARADIASWATGAGAQAAAAIASASYAANSLAGRSAAIDSALDALERRIEALEGAQ